MSAETLVNELVNTVKSEVSKSSEKLNKFIDEYNSKFENKAYGGDIYILSQVILPLLRGCLML
jgi:deoxyadenosine/deoxycytidine kinase